MQYKQNVFATNKTLLKQQIDFHIDNARGYGKRVSTTFER